MSKQYQCVSFLGGPKSGERSLVEHLLIKTKNEKFILSKMKTRLKYDIHPISTFLFYELSLKNYDYTLFYNPYSFSFAMKGFAHSDISIITLSSEVKEKDIPYELLKNLTIARAYETQVIFCISKMDVINYSEKLFFEKSKVIEDQLKGFGVEKYVILPISVAENDNIFQLSSKMEWWKGKSLIEYLEATVPPKIIDQRFKTSVIDIFTVRGIGPVFLGKVLCGTTEYDNQVFSKTFHSSILSVSSHNRTPKDPQQGQFVGITVRYYSRKEILKGSIVSDSSYYYHGIQEEKTGIFYAKVVFTVPLNSINELIKIYVHSAKILCKVNSIFDTEKKEFVSKVETKKEYIIELYPSAGYAEVDTYFPIPTLGRFCFQKNKDFIGFGKIYRVLTIKQSLKMFKIQNITRKGFDIMFDFQ